MTDATLLLRAPATLVARLRTRTLPALAIMAAVAVGACGGSDGGGTTEPEEPARATTIDISQASLSFASLGETTPLTATVRDQNGNPIAGASVSWGSSDESVARISIAGVVRSIGNGSATITATSGSATGQMTVTVEQIATSLDFVLDSLVLPWGGASTTLEATARDAGGSAVAGNAVDWTSGDEAIATVSTDGLISAVSQGQVIVIAASGEVADTLPVRVAQSTPDTPAIIGVDPGVIVEGDTAVVTGERFGGHPSLNQVTVDGLPAQVVAATSTELRLVVPESDCRPLRSRSLVVSAFGEDATTQVSIQPASLANLAVGEAVFADGCIQLDAVAGTPGYMIGVLSTSETPSSLTPAGVESELGDPAPATIQSEFAMRAEREGGPQILRPIRPMSAAASTAYLRRSPSPAAMDFLAPSSPEDMRMAETYRRHWEAEQRLRQADVERIRRLGPIEADEPTSGSEMAVQGVPGVGDAIPIKVTFSCSEFTPIVAEVTFVSSRLIIVEDQENPAASRLTQQELEELGDLYDAQINPMLTSNYGPFTDLDSNGRLIVVLTRAVNDRGGILGFVSSGDFFQVNQCAASDFGELFYGFIADPNDEIPGPQFSKEQFLEALPPLVAHEATHIIQLGNQVLGDAGSKSGWELEGGATLAEQLAGFRVAGLTPGNDYGWDVANSANGYWWRDWYNDMPRYFGFRSSTFQEPDAPEQCSWAGNAAAGNDGPCSNGRAIYGTPSMFLRMVMDRYGDQVAGGPSGFLQGATLARGQGIDNIASFTGQPAERILAEFSIALWADGRVGDWITTWNLADVFSNFFETARLNPKSVFGLAPEVSSVSVRALSTGYFDWDPGSDHPPVALRLTDSNQNAPADHMRFWILRTQ